MIPFINGISLWVWNLNKKWDFEGPSTINHHLDSKLIILTWRVVVEGDPNTDFGQDRKQIEIKNEILEGLGTMVTRFPNHWWASSCPTTRATHWRDEEQEFLGSMSRAVSLWGREKHNSAGWGQGQGRKTTTQRRWNYLSKLKNWEKKTPKNQPRIYSGVAMKFSGWVPQLLECFGAGIILWHARSGKNKPR